MTASDVVAPKKPAAPSPAGNGSSFEPSVWGDFFVTYNPPASPLGSEKWMRQRVNDLKGEVCQMFEPGKASATDVLKLVDSLERLGVEHHFRGEIDAALSRVRDDPELEFVSSNNLYIVSLRFRILRQHGIRVSADVFDKFKDGSGSFSTSLCDKPRELLSLYNAAHMATPEETALDDAITFARRHLETLKGRLRSPLVEQVTRALDIPLPRIARRLETMHYIAEYGVEEGHDTTILELARLDFEIVRLLHLMELKEVCRWWRDLCNDVKLPYVRDRMVEVYFWACEIVHGEENSRARMIFLKTFALTSLIDDTYDVHATLEECQKFNEAMQRWHESAVSKVPEYLRILYLKTLEWFKEFEGMLEPDEKHRILYAKNVMKMHIGHYFKEATWVSQHYKPSFKEHVEVTAISSGLPMLTIMLMVGLGREATKEALDWAQSMPDVILSSGEVGRFLNDLASYKMGKNKKDVASSLDCYMAEYGATGEEASAAIANMAEQAWRRINRACLEMDPALLRAAQFAVVEPTRSVEIIYVCGRDGYTFGSQLKDLVTSLYLKPVPV